MLRDPNLFAQGADQLERLAEGIRDHNFRMYAEGGELHLLTKATRISAQDPFEILRELEKRSACGELPPLTASHAFYLGFELGKAEIANRLGKQYRQDEPLRWGMLTEDPATPEGNQ